MDNETGPIDNSDGAVFSLPTSEEPRPLDLQHMIEKAETAHLRSVDAILVSANVAPGAIMVGLVTRKYRHTVNGRPNGPMDVHYLALVVHPTDWARPSVAKMVEATGLSSQFDSDFSE